MQNRYVISGFSKMNDDAFATLGTTIIGAMTGNPNFETPNPSLASIQPLLDDFREKLARTRKGSPLDTSEKNNSRKLMETELKKLAFYVNTVANGALHMALSSGFPLQQVRTPLDSPGIPERGRLTDTQQSGQLRFDFDPVKGAYEYEYAYTAELDEQGEPLWGELLRTSNSRSNIIAPLTPGSIYRVRVRARNKRGISDWSAPVSRMAR